MCLGTGHASDALKPEHELWGPHQFPQSACTPVQAGLCLGFKFMSYIACIQRDSGVQDDLAAVLENGQLHPECHPGKSAEEQSLQW